MKITRSLVSVMDVGSSKLSVICGERLGQDVNVLAEKTVLYSGFSEGEFFEEDILREKLCALVNLAEEKINEQIENLTVGVPAEMCFSTTRVVNVTFAKPTKLFQNVLDEVFESAAPKMEGYTLLSVEPIYFMLDDGMERLRVLGEKTLKLKAKLNVIYVRNYFLEIFNDALGEAGIKTVKYVSSALATVSACLGEKRQRVCVLDVGYLSSSVAIYKGRGLEDIATFSLGNGFMEGEIAEEFDLDFDLAVELRNKLDLLADETRLKFYEVGEGEIKRSIFAPSAHVLAKKHIEKIVYITKQMIEKTGQKMQVFLTGGGIRATRGAKEVLEKGLGQSVGVLKFRDFENHKPHQTSAISLFFMQIN